MRNFQMPAYRAADVFVDQGSRHFQARPGQPALISRLLAGRRHRFHYWTDDEAVPLSDGWWFWKQAEACAYELPSCGTCGRRLCREAPATTQVNASARRATILPLFRTNLHTSKV